jgi:L-alanine-DL-glutamate epimerase-like enolase superfamily enzyme
VIGPLTMRVEMEHWPLVTPFRIAGYTFWAIDALVVTLEKDGIVGRGEAAGVYYRNDRPVGMLEKLRSLTSIVADGIDRESLRRVLPPGGARNALDCALWDLEAKLIGQAAWQIAGLGDPRPLVTTFTCGADEPERMAATARSYAGARAIKLKLTGEALDTERIRAVRDSLPDVWLAVDANQGFDRPTLERLMPAMVDARVALIEQPFPIGREDWLAGLQSPIAIAADESVQCLADLLRLARCFDVINIKLDKCGGLTEGLAMARAARAMGLQAMVGNMMGTSLAIAPAFVLGQLCTVVDLDGPVFLRADRANPVRYADGMIACPRELWG